MKKQIRTWQFILHSLEEKIPVMLLYVLESVGSSPGRQGFFMTVNAKGKMEGSVGGGIMEHKFVELAKEKLLKDEEQNLVRKQVHDKSSAKDRSGMICSGEQTILLYRVKEKESSEIKKIIQSLQENKNGSLELSPEGINFSEDPPKQDFNFSMKTEEDWVYKEKTGYKDHLYIIGGGHCSLALSKIMGMMDFYTHLYDDRENLNTFLENEYAREKKILNDYNELKRLQFSGDRRYVVIMTVGYRTDVVALRALIQHDFTYMGMLGSKRKIEKLFSDLREEGMSDVVLKKIHSPIGIAIKSQTPEEIAISIAAEIIREKNKDLK